MQGLVGIRGSFNDGRGHVTQPVDHSGTDYGQSSHSSSSSHSYLARPRKDYSSVTFCPEVRFVRSLHRQLFQFILLGFISTQAYYSYKMNHPETSGKIDAEGLTLAFTFAFSISISFASFFTLSPTYAPLVFLLSLSRFRASRASRTSRSSFAS